MEFWGKYKEKLKAEVWYKTSAQGNGFSENHRQQVCRG